MRAEASRRGRGVEKRAEAKQRGPREGAGALQAKSKDRKQSDASREAGTRRSEAAAGTKRSGAETGTRQSEAATGNPAATPPER